MRKIIKNGNIYHKTEHNLKSNIYHLNNRLAHILSKDLIRIYDEMGPIYQDIDNDYRCVDLIDLELYERWLNG